MDTTSIGTTIDNIVRENKIFRIAAEFEHTDNAERKILFREILRQLQSRETEIQERARENVNAVCSRLTESQFKKTWQRLTIEQKEEQINRFFKDGSDDEESEKILKMLHEGKLKIKMVEYDKKLGKIEGFNFEKPTKKKVISESDDSENSDS
jgi:hypothetical protein